VQKLAKGVEVEVQAANPVGSTKRDVHGWLTAQGFYGVESRPVEQIDYIMMDRVAALEGATEYISAFKPLVGGEPRDTVHTYFVFGPDGKLIRVYVIGGFIFL
jgi:hypothetical protein